MTYIFGRSIIRELFAFQDEEPIQLPSQSASIFLFDAEPTAEQMTSGDGAIASGDNWQQSEAAPYKCTYGFPPVEDPAPESAVTTRGYWEVVRYLAEAGGEIQARKRYFEIERAPLLPSLPEATDDDVRQIWPGIDAYLNDAKVEGFIEFAEDLVKIDVQKKGIRWTDVHNLKELKLAVVLRAIAESALSQTLRSTDNRFKERHDIFIAKYDAVMSGITLQADTTGDGKPDANVQAKTSHVFLIK